MNEPTERFTQTVQDYVKYRPSYPREVVQLLIDECHLTRDKIIADIGSGTGLLSKLLLENSNLVYGVEPNQAMREAGEEYLKTYPNFHSIKGTAEATTLEKQSIDIITVGTAFHWFDNDKTKVEFRRILKADGWVLLVWNVRSAEHSELIRDYENLLLKYSSEYKESSALKLFDKSAGKEFFSPNEMRTQSFKNAQYFDWNGFKGRLLSTSYSLRPGDSKYEEMLSELKKIFKRYQRKGVVEFLYNTKIYYGRIHEKSEVS
jgi:ubiquinone/menaquinone biosynthesis C-methylase UbiE